MRERTCFLTAKQSMALRGIAILMVMASHYVWYYQEKIVSVPVWYGISRLGVYGVDLFFLASGYGLVKSAQKKRPGTEFLKNRLKNMYLPYLLIAGIIELSAQGLDTVKSWYRYLTGYDYWYIRNAILFYVAFFVIYRFVEKRFWRVASMGVLIYGYSVWLAEAGRADFWYLSNAAFLIGIVAAEYESPLLKAAGRGYWIQLFILGLCMVPVIESGINAYFIVPEAEEKLRCGLAASAVWTLFSLQAASLLPGKSFFLGFLGEMSLELYLSHMFIFFQILNGLTELDRIWQGGLAFGLTVLGSWMTNKVLAKVC